MLSVVGVIRRDRALRPRLPSRTRTVMVIMPRDACCARVARLVLLVGVVDRRICVDREGRGFFLVSPEYNRGGQRQLRSLDTHPAFFLCLFAPRLLPLFIFLS